MKPLVLLALVAIGCAKDPCDGVSGTCVSLHVVGAGVTEVDHLAIDLSGAVFVPSKMTPPDHPDLQKLPVDVGVSIGGSPSGSEVIHVEGWLQGREVGDGITNVDLKPGEHFKRTVTLATLMNDMSMADLPASDLSAVSDGGGADGGDDAGGDLAAPDLAPAFMPLVAGRFTQLVVAEDDSLFDVKEFDSPTVLHLFDGHGTEIALPPHLTLAPFSLEINDSVGFFFGQEADVDMGTITHEIWALHDGRQQLISTTGILAGSPELDAFAVVDDAKNLLVERRAGPGADFTARQVASNIDTNQAGFIFTALFSSGGYFYYQSWDINAGTGALTRLAPGDSSGPGTDLCDGCLPFIIPRADGQQMATMLPSGSDGVLGVAGVSDGTVTTIGSADVDPTLTPIYSVDNAALIYLAASPMPNLEVHERLLAGTLKISTLPSPSPNPDHFVLANASGAVVKQADSSAWWAPWGGNAVLLDQAFSILWDHSPLGAFVYLSTAGPSQLMVIDAQGNKLGPLPNANHILRPAFVDETHLLFIDNNNDLRQIDLGDMSTLRVQSNVEEFVYHPKSRRLFFLRRSASPASDDGIWVGDF